MNIGTLIAVAARSALTPGDGRLGVRLSPISLSPAELTAAITELRAQLGPKAYLVGSAPGVSPSNLDDRAYLAPDQRAAEKATLWRNRVRPAEGERLVYVSVEAHAKASGLRDCLQPLRERDLREALKDAGPKKGGAKSVLEALEEAELLGSLRLTSLCAFVDALPAATKPAALWKSVGDALPLLHLARDSKLTPEDAAARLRSNHALVRTVESGEGRRRASSGPAAKVEAALSSALGSSKGDARAALREVDYGAVKTPAAPKAKATRAAPPAPSAKAKPAPAAPVTMHKASPPSAEPSSPMEAALATPREPSPKATDASPAPKAPSRAVRLVGPALPRGLNRLVAASLSGSGAPVEVVVRDEARAALHSLPDSAPLAERASPRLAEKLPAAYAAWGAARAALLADAARLAGEVAPADAFTRGLASLLADAGVAAAFARFEAAAIELYRQASDADDRTMREALSLDTAAVRVANDVVALRVVGPLHLLSLGLGALGRRAREASAALPEPSQRLIRRALESAPTAPGELPEERGSLPLSRGEAGLLIYERSPEQVPREDAEKAAYEVTTRYLELCPHARLGLRVALGGRGDLEALAMGVARAAQEQPAPAIAVELLCEAPPQLNATSPLATAAREGQVTLSALDPSSARGAHLSLRYASPDGPPEEDEPASASSAPVAARATFELRQHGLRVHVSTSGVAALEAVEALTAAAAGMEKRGAFVTDLSCRSLRAEAAEVSLDGGWLAVVGRYLGRHPPAGWYLIAHERVSAKAECAVIARDYRAATRSLQGALVSLGSSDLRPRPLMILAERLTSAGGSSLVPLSRPAITLVLGGLLAIELRQALGEAPVLVAQLSGVVHETLLGEPEDASGEVFLLAAAQAKAGGLRLVVGCASAGDASALDASKPQLEGPLAKRLGRVLEAISLAGDSSRADGAAAKEALAWALWGALAVDESAPPSWRQALREWEGDVAAPTEVLVLVRGLEPHAKERAAKLGKTKVTVRPLGLERINSLLLKGPAGAK